MAFTLAQAKALCTANELTLVKASTRDEIGKLSVVQVRQKVDRARNLRDKWRDLTEKQHRAAQAAKRGRDTSGNVRSADKAKLFAEVLARFESRLATMEEKGDKGRPAPKRLPPRARSATHRAARADIRAELKEERLALGGRKKPKKAAKPTKAKPLATAASAAATETEPTVTQPAPRRRATPAIASAKATKGKRAHGGAGMTAIESASELQGLRVTKGKQLRAKTAAKKSRLKASGLMRVQKNASARNKRTQGKRDAR